MAKDPLWIEHMHMKKGAMTKAAKKSGMSNSEYEAKHMHDNSTAGHRARLAKVLKHLMKKGK